MPVNWLGSAIFMKIGINKGAFFDPKMYHETKKKGKG